GISGVMEYASDLFERASVEVLAGRLVRLLEAAGAAPEGAIGRLEILSAAGRRTVLEDWNGAERGVAGGALRPVVGGQAAGVRGGTRLRSCLGMSSSATGSLRVAPTSWRISCARLGLVRRAWWGCAWSARWSWWFRSSPSSRPAAPICRSTPATRASV